MAEQKCNIKKLKAVEKSEEKTNERNRNKIDIKQNAVIEESFNIKEYK